jgi:alkylhydroperoxidase/carboxymuconolactone decarboxylase family protein YurZ
VSDESSTPEEVEAVERAEIEEIRSRLANLPNALGVAAKLNSNVIEDAAALDLKTLHLVRVAAMAAVGMPKMGWEVNLELMDDEVTADDVDAVLAAIAPIIGTARYLEAVSTLVAD